MLAEAPAFLSWLLDSSLFSYLDPGAGSVILQVLLATLLGAGWALKMWWGNICRFTSRIFGRAPKVAEPDPCEAQEAPRRAA